MSRVKPLLVLVVGGAALFAYPWIRVMLRRSEDDGTQ